MKICVLVFAGLIALPAFPITHRGLMIEAKAGEKKKKPQEKEKKDDCKKGCAVA